MRIGAIAGACAIAGIALVIDDGSTIDPSLFNEFRWRHIGPVGDAVRAQNTETTPTSSAPRWQVIADTAFPYRVCGARPGDGVVCIASRSDRGQLTVRDWWPVGSADAGFIAIDPGDPEVIFTSGEAVTRFDRRTGQDQDVSPPRQEATGASAPGPLAFSPSDAKTLFHGAHTIWKTTTAGQTWAAIGPDLSSDGRAGSTSAPVSTITAIAPSYIDGRTIWAGTNTGRLHVTRDGGAAWTEVTLPSFAAPADVMRIEPSHFDPAGAYVAVRDTRPRLYRTRDGGASWTDIGALPAAAIAYTVREDALRRGLLFAGADAGAFVSFDDGDSWQSMRLNMPATAVHDLVVKDGDLAAATADRGLWILDDVTPLRQLTRDVARAEIYLFRPGIAWRFRTAVLDRSRGDDAATAANPPDGVIISYLLSAGAAGSDAAPLTMEIIDTASGETLRRLSSDDPATGLATTPGLHRVVWDVRLPPPAAPAPAALRGMFAQPGTYQLRLTQGARVLRQPIVVRIDPRVKTPPADLLLQFKLSKTVHDLLGQIADARAAASARGDATALPRLDAAVPALVDVFKTLQRADARPTDAAQAAATAAVARAEAALKKEPGSVLQRP